MSTTLDNLRTMTRNELFTDPNGKVWKNQTGNANLDNLINAAYLRVQQDGKFNWPASQVVPDTDTSVAAQVLYDLPTKFGRMELMRYDGKWLEQTTQKQIYKYDSDTIDTGTPTNYYILGSQYGLWPTPNESGKTIDVLFREKFTALSNGSDDIEFSDDFARAIAVYASHLAWSQPRGNRDTALQKLEQYQWELELLQVTHQYQVDDIDYRVQRRGYRNPNPLALNRSNYNW